MSPGETAALILGLIAAGVLLAVFLVALATMSTGFRLRRVAAYKLKCGRCGYVYHVSREHNRACPKCAVADNGVHP